MTPRRIAGLALSFALTGSFTVATLPMMPSVAYADPTNVVSPDLHLSMQEVGSATHVCFWGTALVAGSWNMSIQGLRFDTAHALPSQISAGAGLPPAKSFNVCRDITKDLYDNGVFYVNGAYEGGTDSTATVRPGSLSGVTVWYTLGNDVHVETTGG